MIFHMLISVTKTKTKWIVAILKMAQIPLREIKQEVFKYKKKAVFKKS